MMLEHLGHGACATQIRRALERVVRDGKMVTRDLGGTAGTREFADAVIAGLE
jgi:Isocitrate/isopropylmalate dehydrogenase